MDKNDSFGKKSVFSVLWMYYDLCELMMSLKSSYTTSTKSSSSNFVSFLKNDANVICFACFSHLSLSDVVCQLSFFIYWRERAYFNKSSAESSKLL